MPKDRTTLLGQLQSNHAPGPHWEADAEGNPAPENPKVRLIAYFLPQFHPIPENDAWWGEGFTEWTNTSKALPRFAGHFQPRLPACLGFYDLRNPGILHRQARLARRYGIGGFCFHHYWFSGRRLLETPLNLFLADPSIDMPFCILWANENWTRRWDGHEQEILLAQNHSPEDDIAFARHLVPIVKDSRYIHVAGRPLVMLYRPALLPDPLASVRRWRTEFARAGLPNPMIIMAQVFDDNDPRIYGIDAAAEFPPHKTSILSPINDRLEILDPNFTGHVLDYADVADFFATAPRPPWQLFRAVSPSWDNEARRPGRGYTVAHSTPALYGRWLDRACRIAIDEATQEDERIVFINAWNEWAEGAHLEPDRHFGHAYLAETARILAALDRASGATPAPAAPSAIRNDGRLRLALVSHDAHLHGAQTIALALAKSLVVDHNVDLSILIGGAGELTAQFEAVSRCEIVPGDFNDQAAWHDIARRLVGRGVSAILCNTAVSARAMRSLHEAGLRIVHLVHELPSLIRAYHLEDACRDAAAHAAVVVFPSVWVRDRFIEVAGPIRGRAVIRHQGLNLRRMTPDEHRAKRERTRREYSVTDDQRVVLGVGFGDVRKGLDLWPALVRHVVAAVPGARFVWVGRIEPTVRHWLTHDLRSVGLEDHLLLIDQMPDVSPWYAAADLFVLTSREDAFPSVVVEAMACSLPTVVFEKSGGIVDLIHNAGGVTVPYLDVPAMADAIVGLLTDAPRAAEMGRILARRIAADFDYADYAKALIELAAPPTLSLSVVIPNFNYARHLRQRLESIWAQTVCPTEILILDDASSDGSPDLIAALAAESPIPVRVILNDTNSGAVSRQWARGVGLATGDLVWIAEADDFADPGFLAAVLPAFEDPDVVLSYSDSRMVGEDGRVLAPDYRAWTADIDPVRWTVDFRASGLEAVAEAFAVKNTLPNVSAAVFRRAALQAVLDEHVDAMAACRNAADWMCYIRLLAAGGALAFTGRPLNNHRRHEASVTAANDRRHLAEIQAMHDLAAVVASVPAPIRDAALNYRRTVAQQFGIPLEEVQ